LADPQTPEESRMRPSRFRWFIIFLLFAISVINYIDRAAISYSIPQIERDLSLSPVIVVLIFYHPDRDRPKPMLEL
jgi:hypothetical protein